MLVQVFGDPVKKKKKMRKTYELFYLVFIKFRPCWIIFATKTKVCVFDGVCGRPIFLVGVLFLFNPSCVCFSYYTAASIFHLTLFSVIFLLFDRALQRSHGKSGSSIQRRQIRRWGRQSLSGRRRRRRWRRSGVAHPVSFTSFPAHPASTPARRLR